MNANYSVAQGFFPFNARAGVTEAPFRPYVDSCRSVLAEAHRCLVELNRRFLDGSRLSESLAPDLAERIRSLDGPARERLSQCSFPLFKAPFDVSIAQSIPTLPDPSSLEFSVALTSFAWHLARIDEVALRTVLGSTQSDAASLRQTSPVDLHRFASRVASELTARWPYHPHLWPLLIESAVLSNAAGLRRASLLGRQLMASGSLESKPIRRIQNGRRIFSGPPNRTHSMQGATFGLLAGNS